MSETFSQYLFNEAGNVDLNELELEYYPNFANDSNFFTGMVKSETLPLDILEQNFENAFQENKDEEEVIVTKQEERVSAPPLISNEDYPGPYNFDVFIDSHHGNKSPWVFSIALQKVFIKVSQIFPIDFKWDSVDQKNFFIRVTPLYKAPQYSHEIVCRCVTHALECDPSNKGVDPAIWDHIIRCKDGNARYEGSKKANQHLSIIVPLSKPQAGNDTTRYMYEFVCKNSCSSGMNRRLIEIVFTLEDETGNICGRKTVNVRICSCPKRDKDKEEAEHYNKSPLPTKKRKAEKKSSSYSEALDLKEYNLNFNIVGKNNMRAILKHAQGLMAVDMMKHGELPPLKKCAVELSEKINNPSS